MPDVPAKVLVAGAAGFAGALAALLVHRHPSVELAHVTARGEDVGRRLDDLHPRYRVPLELEELDLDRHAGVDAALVAYPHGAAAPTVAALRGRGVKVVDFSADYRLRDLQVYEAWYGAHGAPDRLDEAVYGLPELDRDALRGADLVANPGCYPTATLLALAPLAEAGLIGDLVVDAKSGVSGAGRAPTHLTHFVAADENVSAYGVAGHRHAPEIDQELHRLGAHGIRATFVPHLVPLDQGELVSCYVEPTREVTQAELQRLYADRYAGEPFVELAAGPPGLRDVRDTNVCRISVHTDPRTGKVIAFGAIDNLWKGAASQAVQNLNLMLGLPEGEGIS